MNRYNLYKAGIDVGEGIERFNGNAEIYESCLFRFPSDENYNKMREAVSDGDIHQAYLYAHALKGIVSNLSINGLFKSVSLLVDELFANRTENLEAMLKTVDEDYRMTVSAIGQSNTNTED